MGIVLDLIIVSVVVLFVFLSAKRGFVRLAVEVVGLALSIFIASSFSISIANSVYDNMIKKSIAGNIETYIDTTATDSLTNSVDEIWEHIPKIITDSAQNFGISKQSISSSLENAANKSSEEVANTIADSIAKPVIVSLLKIIAFIIILLILSILVKFLAKSLNRIFKLPVLRGINRILGGILGVLKGLLISAAFCVVISVIINVSPNGFWIFTEKNIDSSYLFKLLCNLNPLR